MLGKQSRKYHFSNQGNVEQESQILCLFLFLKCSIISFTCRVKVFRGRKVHGDFDIKVEQVGHYLTLSLSFKYLLLYLSLIKSRDSLEESSHVRDSYISTSKDILLMDHTVSDLFKFGRD